MSGRLITAGMTLEELLIELPRRGYSIECHACSGDMEGIIRVSVDVFEPHPWPGKRRIEKKEFWTREFNATLFKLTIVSLYDRLSHSKGATP